MTKRKCNLRHYMEETGMTNAEVARRIGVSKGHTVGRWLDGVIPNSVNQQKLVDLFGCTFEDLWPVRCEVRSTITELALDQTPGRFDRQPVQERIPLDMADRRARVRKFGTDSVPVYMMETLDGELLGVINPMSGGRWVARTSDIIWRCDDLDEATANLAKALNVTVVSEVDNTVDAPVSAFTGGRQ